MELEGGRGDHHTTHTAYQPTPVTRLPDNYYPDDDTEAIMPKTERETTTTHTEETGWGQEVQRIASAADMLCRSVMADLDKAAQAAGYDDARARVAKQLEIELGIEADGA